MNLICPFATQNPGPPDLVYPQVNTFSGAILHSAEGHWSGVYGPLDTMRQRRVSWHFSIHQDGYLEQHYALGRSCWHAGNQAANLRLVGIEHEGRVGEALTPLQLAKSIELVRWIAQQGQWDGLQRDGNLFEHREFYATSCPSGRIPWERYTEEDDVDVRALDVSESIAKVQRFVREATDIIGDTDGGMYEVVGGFPNARPGYEYVVLEMRKDA